VRRRGHRRNRKRQHLRHRPGIYPKATRRLAMADPHDPSRVPDSTYSSTSLIPQPSAFNAKIFTPMEICSGQPRNHRYSSEGVCLRRVHAGAPVAADAHRGALLRNAHRVTAELKAAFTKWRPRNGTSNGAKGLRQPYAT